MQSDVKIMLDNLHQVVLNLRNNIAISEQQYEKFGQYYEYLLEVNKTMNLTRIVAPLESAAKHYGDALTVYDDRIFQKGRRVIDVGTGAGFPGVPLAILREDLQFTLMDSLRKRTQFIVDASKIIGLHNIEVVHARAEDLGRNPLYREKYDIVLARAVASLNVLLEICLPFLKIGGVFIAMKGPKAEEEVQMSGRAMELLGGGNLSMEMCKLPLVDEDRVVIRIEKMRSTPLTYPRKAGIPERDPLK